MWAGPTTARGRLPQTGRVLGPSPGSGSKPAANRRPREAPGPPKTRPSTPATTTGTTAPPGTARPDPPGPDGPGPPEPVQPLVGPWRSSLGFISTPLIWPGRKRPSRGRPPSTTRGPTRPVDATKPTAKPKGTPAPTRHPAGLGQTLDPSEDWLVSGQGSEEAGPPEVSNRKIKAALPRRFLETQTGEDGFRSLPDQAVHDTSGSSYGPFHATASPEPGPGTTGPEVRPQDLGTFVQSSLSSDLPGTLEVTGYAAASLPVSLAGVTAATASDIPEVWALDVSSTLSVSERPEWTAGFRTGDQSEPPLPGQVVQTHPPPLPPSINPSPPPLSSFTTPVGRGRGPGGPGIPDQTPGLDFRPPAPGSGFPSRSPPPEAFVFKLLPPAGGAQQPADPVDFTNVPGSNRTAWTTLKDRNKAGNATEPPQVTTAARPATSTGSSERPTASRPGPSPGDSWTGSPDPAGDLLTSAAPFDRRRPTATRKSGLPAEGVVGDAAPPESGPGPAEHSPACACERRARCPCGLSLGNST